MRRKAIVQSAQFWKAALFATAAVLVFCAGSAAGAMVSYDAAGNALPSDPIRYLDTTRLLGPEILPTISGGVLSLGPTSNAGYSFWYTDALTVDHTQSVDISARLKLNSESSTNSAQSGFAIAFTDDRDLYQDLFFTPTGVFFDKLDPTGTQRVQDGFFAVDTTQYHNYDLKFSGNSVTLSVDGKQDLSGLVFDVAATGDVVLPDFVSFGDISSTSQSSFALTSFSAAVVPEPSFAVPAMLALAGMIAWRKRPVRAAN
jgi:hypothetical protein